MITAPYNFVPLNKEVFYPSWSDQVSHDVPFADGESGEIDITITAKSPIFIRDHEKPEEFCQHNGQYYIPSTSVKGMVRNVLEIMSFGEMRVDEKKLSQPMSIRDMSNTRKLVGVATGCGFLKQDSQEQWYIEDYGKPRTIKYTKNKTLTIGTKNYQLTNNDENMSAQEKYGRLDTNYKIIRIKKEIEDLKNRDGNKIGTKPVAKLDNQGESAYLICTGEITNKKHEFVFASSDRKQEHIANIEDAVARFKTIYFDSDSVDGNYWKNHYDPNIGIPVFYRKKDGKYDIGLTQLFKLLYPHTLKNAVKQTIKSQSLDLVKTIFGTEEEKSALKGRVYFSHFKTEATPQVFIKDLTMTLGGPKPSFYPTYLQQNCQQNGKVQNDKYHTLMDNGEIAGWKRYPIHHNRPNVQSISPSDTTTTFNPLGKYKQDGKFEEFSFTGKLRYHNLKPEELGAILSALTFHANQQTFYHNIGLAKAHGFGKIEMTVDVKKHTAALQAFEAMMTLWTKEKLQKDWFQTEQIKELFAMHYKETNIDDKLTYLVLDPENRINQFSDVKNEKQNKQYKGRECLPKFSVLSDFSNTPKSLFNEKYFEQVKAQKELEKEAQQEQEDFEYALQSDNMQVIENYIKNHPNNVQISILKVRLEELKKAQENDKFKDLNEQAKKAYESAVGQKDKNQRKKFIESWLTKWSNPDNNLGSEVILDLVEKAKKESK